MCTIQISSHISALIFELGRPALLSILASHNLFLDILPFFQVLKKGLKKGAAAGELGHAARITRGQNESHGTHEILHLTLINVQPGASQGF